MKQLFLFRVARATPSEGHALIETVPDHAGVINVVTHASLLFRLEDFLLVDMLGSLQGLNKGSPLAKSVVS